MQTPSGLECLSRLELSAQKEDLAPETFFLPQPSHMSLETSGAAPELTRLAATATPNPRDSCWYPAGDWAGGRGGAGPLAAGIARTPRRQRCGSFKAEGSSLVLRSLL